MTAGYLPTQPGGMLTETYPPRQRIAGPVLWALTSGITGLLANVLLVLFFLLAKPFESAGRWLMTCARTSCGWPPTTG